MSEQPFTTHQLFHSKQEKLEEKILNFYQETQDSTVTIQVLLAAKVRYQLGDTSFHLFMKGLVRHLFSKATINRALRRYFFFFADYFTKDEWQKLTARCFPAEPVTTELFEVTEAHTLGTDLSAAESS
ncbi:hypothetical protein [Enterococcus sp. AZ163]|uniref:hypothetical protein n=1 Tax=Enterococcus sp. AZ163 TaxID=2774638 RepID=UPI003D2C6C35